MNDKKFDHQRYSCGPLKLLRMILCLVVVVGTAASLQLKEVQAFTIVHRQSIQHPIINSWIHTDTLQRQTPTYHHNRHHQRQTTTFLTAITSSSSSSTQPLPPLVVSDQCQLAQLSKMTTISIDSGDIELIRQYAATGYITDATTNPLFVAQTAFKTQSSSSSSSDHNSENEDEDDESNSIYRQMVNDAVVYAVETLSTATTTSTITLDVVEKDIVALAMDRLAVNLGATIATIPGLTQGYISTEVDPRLSFNIPASIQRALRMIDMYETDYQISRDRVLIKLAATWEGIMTAKILHEQHNIKCNLTLIFSIVQGLACAQYNVHLISPFPGRILDYYNQKLQRSAVDDPQDDEGVMACTYMYNYFKYYNHTTFCMPASWRPSRGKPYELDEIQALAGTDRMTIPVPLLSELIQNKELLPRKLFPTADHPLSSSPLVVPDLFGNGQITEDEFRYLLTMDGCGNDKLAEGLRSFCQLTEQLELVMTEKVRTYLGK